MVMTLLVFILFGISFAQDDSQKNIKKEMEQIEKENKSISNEEQKLCSGLLISMLRLAEKADSSDSAKQELKKEIKTFEENRPDSKDRIHIVLTIRSLNDMSNVVEKIQSFDGFIEEAGKSVPYIICKIHPKWLLNLIRDDSIMRITNQMMGHTQMQ
jgi:hypothetical protein